MMITDSTIRFKIPAKEPKSHPKAKVDPKMYPEHWRNPEIFKPDHWNTAPPYQVIRLEKILRKSNSEFCILVRKHYHPQDTHLSKEEARTKPYTVLHWSEEMAMMYPREVAAKKQMISLQRTSMDKVVGLCHVRPQEDNIKEDNLIEWTDKGEDRFFVDKLYNAKS